VISLVLWTHAVRLFVAVDPAPEVIARIEQVMASALRPRAPGARWVHAAGLHLTLAFLGEVQGDLVPDLTAALTAVAAAHARFSLRFQGGESFGSPRRPRTLWVGVRGDVEALSALQRDVTAALVPLGHKPEERSFSPHLTLARSREPRGDPALAACREPLDVDFGETSIAAIRLYQSVLGPQGARYTALTEAALRGPSS
jgi:2'-5' RNA ligase